MPKYRVNLDFRNRADELRAQNEAKQEQFARQRVRDLDLRYAVRESSDRGIAYDPQQIAQDIFTQMGIAESMTDEEEGPDSRVMRTADRKINYNWRLLWQLASEGDERAMAQINLLQGEMIDYKQVRTEYRLKKIRKNLFAGTFIIAVLLGIALTSTFYERFVPATLLVGGLILVPYFIVIQPTIKRKAYQEALGGYT